jgi:hypothetical protein
MRFGLRWKVGHLVPGLLLLFMVTDAALRLTQGVWGIFSASSGMRRSQTPGEAFLPNLRFEVPVTYGDLARMANIRDRDEQRSFQFSTDGLGFRNVEASGPVAGILFGDSFAMAGDDDRETLSAQLGQRIGCTIYNAASPDDEFRRPDLALVRSLAKRIGMANGFVIVEQIERRAVESRSPRERPVRGKFRQGWSQFWRQLGTLTRDSPVKRLAENVMKSIRDDRILPNNYLDNVVQGKLRNGIPMLFLPSELKTYEVTRLPPLDYWIKLNQELGKVEFKLLVVLVPNKHTVYRYLLEGEQKQPRGGQDLLPEIASALRAAGVSATDLTSVLRQHADAAFKQNKYVYWRNDTHWNAAGVGIAADEIVRMFPELRKGCR